MVTSLFLIFIIPLLSLVPVTLYPTFPPVILYVPPALFIPEVSISSAFDVNVPEFVTLFAAIFFPSLFVNFPVIANIS